MNIEEVLGRRYWWTLITWRNRTVWVTEFNSSSWPKKNWFKTKYEKTEIMISGPITSWQTEEEKVEVVTDFLFLGSKITADGECSHEIRRWLLLGRKAMTNLDSVLRSRDFILPTKGPYSQVCGLSSGMYGCESCTVKKAEYQRIDVLELWCWRRLLKVPWTARR